MTGLSTATPTIPAIATTYGFIFGGLALLLATIVLGKYVARLISGRSSLIIGGLLLLVSASGACSLVHDFQTNFPHGWWSILITFFPVYLCMGLYLGNENRGLDAQNELKLAAWREQLTVDRQAGANPLRLAHDYREIARLLNNLGRRQEAIDEYRQGMTILEISLFGHPSMAEFYGAYLNLLRSSTDAEEIARIKTKRDALPKI